MRHILLATDLSDRSDRAFERAVLLAEHFKARLHLLCAVDDDLPDRLTRSIKAETEVGLREAAAAAQARGVDASWSIDAGRPHVAILRAAAERPCDLMLLGSHRESQFSDLFLGTTVERVVRYGRTPLLMVRQRAREAYGKVLVAADFSPPSERALCFALSLAPTANFRVVHAFETPFPAFLPRANYAAEVRSEREGLLKALVAKCAVSPAGGRVPRISSSAVEGEVEGALRQLASEEKPELIALGTHGRTGLAHAILGSIAESMLRNPPCDILAVR